jgi:hypothetical protein
MEPTAPGKYGPEPKKLLLGLWENAAVELNALIAIAEAIATYLNLLITSFLLAYLARVGACLVVKSVARS